MPSFKVSADAVIFNAAGLQIAVVENGVSGLKRGDQVILNPAADLAHGAKVRPRPPAAVS
jgi:hypothetical protein